MRVDRFKDLLAWGTAQPDYAAGLRAATATIVPLVIGEATGRPQLLWVALGGWLATFADPGGPYPLRAITLGGYGFASAASVFVGTLCAAHPAISVPVLFAWAVGCALLRVYGDAAGGVGSLSLIAFCIALGTPLPNLHGIEVRAGLFVLGVGWAALMALSLWPVRPWRPVRMAVAACHRALARHARELGGSGLSRFELAGRDRAAIRARLEVARAVLGSVRGARNGESPRSDLLVALYEAAELCLGDFGAIAETLLSQEERGEAPPPWLQRELEAAAAALEAVAAVAEEERARLPPFNEVPSEGPLEAPVRALRSHVRLALGAAAALQGNGDSAAVSAHIRLPAPGRRSLREVLTPRSLEFRHAIRVGATAAGAALLGLILHRARGYWIIVTAVIVLQPHAGATLRRGLQRIAGTVAGAMIAALLAPLVQGGVRAALVLFALALAAAAFRRHNYAVYAALMTPLFVLMAESTSGDWHLARTRISSTLLGGIVALFGSYALWPQRERERLPAALGEVLRTTRRVLESARSGAPLQAARREAGLALANADAAFERFLDEAHRPQEAEAMMAVRSQSRRLVGAIVALTATGSFPPELGSAARQIDEALDALAAAARDGRAPPPLPALSAAPQGERLARPVEVIHSALSRLASGGEQEAPAIARG